MKTKPAAKPTAGKAPLAYDPKKHCFPPKAISDAALRDYWQSNHGRLPPTAAEIARSNRDDAQRHKLIRAREDAWRRKYGAL